MECDIPESVLYIRNVNGPKGDDGMVKGFFPIARGIKTDRYTFEVAIKKNGTLAGITIFDDLQDPYQLKNIDYRTCPELFESLWNQLNEKLAEANDIWHRNGILEKLNIL